MLTIEDLWAEREKEKKRGMRRGEKVRVECMICGREFKSKPGAGYCARCARKPAHRHGGARGRVLMERSESG